MGARVRGGRKKRERTGWGVLALLGLGIVVPLSLVILMGLQTPESVPETRKATTGGFTVRALLPPVASPRPDPGAQVTATMLHDPSSFTQGLVVHEGVLLESTGLYGESKLRRLDMNTGAVLASVDLPARFFGEGIDVVNGKVLMLTWKERTGFVYDPASLALEREFAFDTSTGEGWGITHMPGAVVVSDGSHRLHFWDPDTLKETRRVEVHERGRPVSRINELEYIPEYGVVLANLWYSDDIVAIDPADGRVRARIRLHTLYPAQVRRAERADVLNGIAYDAATGELILTGKLWGKLYRVRQWAGALTTKNT